MTSLAGLSHAEKLEAIALLEAKIEKHETTKLYRYRPYPKQMDFHRAGGDPAVRERLLMAGNQLGKTMSAAYETAMHLTGWYPKWWPGAQYEHAVCAWAAGVTSEGTRDNPQRLLLGRPGSWGTGAIPKESIVDIRRATHGVTDSVDTVTVRHKCGNVSTLAFKAYEKGREKWQGETLDFVWYDEEPPLDIYSEGLTRTNATQGIVWVTFTPLLGMSDVVKRFLLEKVPGTHVTSMTIEDALHYTPEQRAAIIAAYPAHERDARAKGIPILGSGRVFPIAEEVISEKAISIPKHWPRICGIDFGWDHPTAAVWIAWDRDTDTIHVYDAYRVKEATPVVHSAAIKSKGAWIPVAWPHDGLQHDKGGSCEQLANQYKGLGLNMLPNRATFEDGGNGVEAGVMELLSRMETGRIKVAAHLHDWWEEFRLYHRKDGRLVKTGDDLMSATRYATMMLRKAITRPSDAFDKPIITFTPHDMAMGY